MYKSNKEVEKVSFDCGNKEGMKQKRIGKRGTRNDKGGTVILEQLLIFFSHRVPIGL